MQNTQTKTLLSASNNSFLLQSGTIADGLTSSTSNYPINIADTTIYNPNNSFGATQMPFISLVNIYDDYRVSISGEWTNKITSGDTVKLKRGSITNNYKIKNLFFDGSNTYIQFYIGEALDSFIGITGYPTPSPDTYLAVNNLAEFSSDYEDLVKDFKVTMIPGDSTDYFSISAAWQLDHKAKKTKLRWRAIPQNSQESLLSFNVVSGGQYSQIPSASIISDSGRLAQIILNATSVGETYSVSDVVIKQQGGNYLSTPLVIVDNTYAIGTTAQITSSLQLKNEGRINYIRVVNGGTGYTGANIAITGSAYSTDAIGYCEINNGSISNIILQSSGYGYTSSHVTITPTGTGGTGACAEANIDMYSKWIYENPLSYDVFNKTISGFKYNIKYEIEILASSEDSLGGLYRYTNTINFQFYK